MTAILAVNQNGPRIERRYRWRISFQPSIPQSGQSFAPSITSAQALFNPREVLVMARLCRKLSGGFNKIFGCM